MPQKLLEPQSIQIWSFNQDTTENSHDIVSKRAKISPPTYNSNSGAFSFIAQDNGRDYLIEISQIALQAMADAKKSHSKGTGYSGSGAIQ